MNPDQFSTNNQSIPEDVMGDARIRERLVIEADLEAEAEALHAELKAKAEEAATHAVQQRVRVEISPRGRVRRNGPCPCGSGRKFKKCCLAEVKDPEGEKKLPSPKAIRAYMRRPQ